MLRQRAVAAFDRATAALGADPGAEPARALLSEQRGRLLSTLRVAVVGRVSSGKSTLVNALLGGYRVPTGATELTYNVNWLRYGAEPGILIHFRDGQAAQRRELTDLERMTVRAGDDPELRDFLSRIDYVEVRDTNPQLLDFDVIDTPGLDSYFRSDSANTLRFLGRAEEDVRAATVAHGSQADALVLVFARGLARGDAELLADFQGAGLATATPITAVGALTKVELYWPDRDPMAEGRRVAGMMMSEAGASRLLFELRPVASLVGAGAATLTEDEYGDLAALARLAPDLLARRVALGPLFTGRNYDDMPVPPARRRALFGKLGGYGIVLSCGLIRDGLDSRAGLRQELIDRSGMAAFKRLLGGHFGNHADAIKLQRVIAVLQERQRLMLPDLPPKQRLRMDSAVAEVTRLGFAEHAFAELAVLQHHYDGRLELTAAEAAELLRVTGEQGTSVGARLGLPEEVGAGVLLRQARERLVAWASYSADPSHSGPTRRAGQTIQRSYELIIEELTAGGAVLRTKPGVMGAL
ncbi:MAG: dynamin family protein [Trebonia sp.]|jgi:GTPase SAR1 family protein